MAFTASPEHSARSRAAANSRWAAASPKERARQGQLLRDGAMNKYRAKAQNLAIANGWVPTAENIERSAIALRKADISLAQLAAFEAMRTKSGAPAPTHAPTAAGINERAREAASNPPPATDADLAELKVWLAERQAALAAEFDAKLAKVGAQ